MDSIGGMLNPIGQMPKTVYKKNFVMFYWKKIMVYGGILMANIGISVMVSIGLLLFLLFNRVSIIFVSLKHITIIYT